MRKPLTLSVDVSELLRRPGASERFVSDPVLDGLQVTLAHTLEGSSLHLDVRLEALVDGIHVSGPVEGDVEVECRRCLKRLVRHVRVDLEEVFVYPGEVLGPDAYEIVDEHVDLEPVVRDSFVLSLPLNPLCRADCRGLCTTCGADLNEVDCGHSQQPVDIRWSGLEQLKRTLED
ncbi:MAG: YceD family protein [Actinomycetota bacterium]